MAKLQDHKSANSTKMLLIGDPGSGKTGALASLASAGWNLRILDFDAGLDILANVLKDPKGGYSPDALDRVEYETVTDSMKSVGGKLIPAKATAWQKAVKLLDNWCPANGAGADLGPLTSWGPKDILVIDSLTFLSKAALDFILSMNAKLGQQPEQSHWYHGQQLIEGLLAMLKDDAVRCNVIVIAHIAYIGEENGPIHGYPNSLGRALPPKIGAYFNSCLMVRSSGSGNNVSRKIFTRTVSNVELKNSSPSRAAVEYPQKDGLAQYFRDVQSGAEGAAKP